MTILDHFDELRNRLFIGLSAWVVGAGITFAFRFDLLDWLQAPLPPAMTLAYFSVLEPFVASMQIASFFGVVLAAPLIVGQVWGFVSSALSDEERRYAGPFIAMSALAFAGGVAFAYWVVLPFTLPILLGFLGDQAQGLLSIGRYISTLLLLMGVFGLLFEMPVVGYLFARIGLLRSEPMVRHRRWALLGSLVGAAGITPTADPFNFALVAGPIVVLYELTIVVVRVSQRRHAPAPAGAGTY